MGIKIHIFEILKLNKFLYTVFPMALPRQGSGLQPVFRNPSGLSPEKNRKSFFGKRGKIKKVEGPDHGRRRSGPPSPTPAPVLERFGPVTPYGGSPLENGLEGFYGGERKTRPEKPVCLPRRRASGSVENQSRLGRRRCGSLCPGIPSPLRLCRQRRCPGNLHRCPGAQDKKGSGSEGVSPIAGNDPSRIRGDSGYPTGPERSFGSNASGLTKAGTEPFSRSGHGRTPGAGLSENAQ